MELGWASTSKVEQHLLTQTFINLYILFLNPGLVIAFSQIKFPYFNSF